MTSPESPPTSEREATAQAIWKFPIDLTEQVKVSMPRGARPLHFANQEGQFAVWALVWPDNPVEDRRFQVFGTGHPIIGGGLTYIGTCLDGPFVWHLFESVS